MPGKSRVLDLEDRTKDAIAILEAFLRPSPIRGRGTVLADMLKRAEQPSGPDGFPTRGSGAGDEGRGGGPSIRVGDDTVPLDSSTEAAMFARVEDICSHCEAGKVNGRTCKYCGGSGKRWADPIADAAHATVVDLKELARIANRLDRYRETIMGAADRFRGREDHTQGPCDACGTVVSGNGEDRKKRGFCPRCYFRWTAWALTNKTSDPGADRRRFIEYMGKWLADKALREAAEVSEIARLQARSELPTGRKK